MKRLLLSATAAAGITLLAALSLASGAAGTPTRASATLPLHFVVGGTFSPTKPECTQPPDVSFYRCYDRAGEGIIPGLGVITLSGARMSCDTSESTASRSSSERDSSCRMRRASSAIRASGRSSDPLSQTKDPYGFCALTFSATCSGSST